MDIIIYINSYIPHVHMFLIIFCIYVNIVHRFIIAITITKID
jgi:hypothetical protein